MTRPVARPPQLRNLDSVGPDGASAFAGLTPACLRGETIQDILVSFARRGSEAEFSTPDPAGLVARLPLRDPTKLSDAHNLRPDA